MNEAIVIALVLNARQLRRSTSLKEVLWIHSYMFGGMRLPLPILNIVAAVMQKKTSLNNQITLPFLLTIVV